MASSRSPVTGGRRSRADPRPTQGSVPPSLGRFGNSLVFRVTESGGYFLLSEARPVVAIDRQRDAAVLLQVARPRQGAIEAIEFLEQQPLLLQGRHRAGAGRTAEDSISHGQSPVLDEQRLRRLRCSAA